MQAYTRMHFGPEGLAPDDPSVPQTQMGTENWPGAVAHCVRRTERGFFVWSLLDNFEWNMGFRPKLGLHAVDRVTFARTPKPSAAWCNDLARTNRLAPSGD